MYFVKYPQILGMVILRRRKYLVKIVILYLLFKGLLHDLLIWNVNSQFLLIIFVFLMGLGSLNKLTSLHGPCWWGFSQIFLHTHAQKGILYCSVHWVVSAVNQDYNYKIFLIYKKRLRASLSTGAMLFLEIT